MVDGDIAVNEKPAVSDIYIFRDVSSWSKVGGFSSVFTVSITVFVSGSHVRSMYWMLVAAAPTSNGTMVNKLNTSMTDNSMLTGFLSFRMVFPPFGFG